MLKDRKGISPIIGVILVVAMTVLLAVIAWTYMSGMVTSPGKAYMVQPVVTKEAPNTIKVRFEGKDVPEIYKVDFTGSRNDTSTINTWYLYNGSYVYNDTAATNKINVTPNEPTANLGQATAFTFGDTTESGTNATIRTKQTLHPSYVFITKQATPGARTNTIIITVTFKDGTTQTFEYKV